MNYGKKSSASHRSGSFGALVCVAISLGLSACASGITNVQKQELLSYKARGYYVQEKSEGKAAGLGILPGGGSFYTRNYGLGVLNLLVWPFSVLWDPVSGVNGAQSLNYAATKANVEKLRRSEVRDLDEQFALKRINNDGYLLRKNEIERKYEP